MMRMSMLRCVFLVMWHVWWLTAKAESECIYTDTEGHFCNCDGSNKNCLVAEINWQGCGDEASSIMTLVNQCVPAKAKDKKHVAYKQKCANGDVARQWYHNEDCSGPVSKIEALSTLVQPCAQIVCMAPDAETGLENDAGAEPSIAAQCKLPVLINSFLIFYAISLLL
mmetsp:Transcript_35457/g.56838  ORF Transcript_35457/g.56838 Transcript_35457/m.56838 type:complete len:168 (+) Transcript_35457:829-1332(+)